MAALIDVLVPTLTGRLPGGLEHVPGLAGWFLTSQSGWAKAANWLLDGGTNDVLLMDDDVTLTPHTFSLFDAIRPHADIIGFTLVLPGGEVQSAGLSFLPHVHGYPLVGHQRADDLNEPAYVAHVSASCMFIKRCVIESGLRFPEWPGLLYEDVRFTVKAWLKGFRVAYCPGMVCHEWSATKNRAADKGERVRENYGLLVKWLEEIDIGQRLKDGEVPIGRQPLSQVSASQDTEARRPA